MDWDGINLREYDRMDGEAIPEGMANFDINFGEGELVRGKTTDFSIKGIRVVVQCPDCDFKVGEALSLSPSGFDYTLIGQIAYSFETGEPGNLSYLGIKFLPCRALKKYILEVNNVLQA